MTIFTRKQFAAMLTALWLECEAEANDWWDNQMAQLRADDDGWRSYIEAYE